MTEATTTASMILSENLKHLNWQFFFLIIYFEISKSALPSFDDEVFGGKNRSG